MMKRSSSFSRLLSLFFIALIMICSTPTPPIMLPEAAAEASTESSMSRKLDTGVRVMARSHLNERQQALALQPEPTGYVQTDDKTSAALACAILAALFAGPSWSRNLRLSPCIARFIHRILLSPVRKTSYAA
ncbi:hypothetical protein [Paenibacillus pasadenensis]|uniref:hypothetical protein n=1 Tax=Paenibacillus pasadenensis TaxID=217090 RepID=UPI00203D002B|nr:hypothetical protein [Paenibacillus pasadenensis]